MDRIALLSNINLNFVIRKLKKSFEIYETEGYGNELGHLLNPASSYFDFAPKVTFLVMDLAELVQHNYKKDNMENILTSWFGIIESVAKKGGIFYISDAYLYCPEMNALPESLSFFEIESVYNNFLSELLSRCTNVRVFPYGRLVRSMGEANVFSEKMWYLGKIMHSNEFQNLLTEEIEKVLVLENRTPKKVLVLDMDNTLWGGLAGDYPETDIILSEDHQGLAYKNGQRVIKLMQEAGVILAIASKNNEKDAMLVLEKHPHMVIKKDDFAAMQIHWEPKSESLKAIARELNVGLDSFVFWDDQSAERELIKQMLPEVIVPDFPQNPEDLSGALIRVYEEYFKKPRITVEDYEKTKQYLQNRQRKELESKSIDFGEYLKSLDIKIERVDPKTNLDRFHQLVNKTNQFNLTTKRYELSELQNILDDKNKKVYLYRISDRFGDYGIVSALIVDCERSPLIEEFVLSCRVMGKRVEHAIITNVEQDLEASGFESLKATYIKSAKNMPVENLFENLSYNCNTKCDNGDKTYEISLGHAFEREYYVTFL